MTDQPADDAERPVSGTRRGRRNTRPRDELGRPMPYGSAGVGELPTVTRSARDALIEAHRLLGDGRPFHAHEVLEDAWKSGPDAERDLWRGLAQLAVGVTHAARGNPIGATRLIERGGVNIARYAEESPHGLDVTAVLEWCAQARAEIADQCPIMLTPPPLRPAPPAVAEDEARSAAD